MWIIVDHNDFNKYIGPFETSAMAVQWLSEKGYADYERYEIGVHQLHSPSTATIDETK